MTDSRSFPGPGAPSTAASSPAATSPAASTVAPEAETGAATRSCRNARAPLEPALPASDPRFLASLDEASLERQLRERTDQAWRLACDVHPELPRPGVWFDLRGRSAGQAHHGRGGLRFNRTLLRENRQAFMDEIVPHEMAHWLVFHLEGGLRARPHGREWQTVMRSLYGLKPTTTHRFDVSRASPMPYVYRCQCETRHRFSARRHAQARRGAQYRCRRCRGRLEFERVDAPD